MNIKSYTSIEQSRVLAEIIPLESADMYYEEVCNLPKVIVGSYILHNQCMEDKDYKKLSNSVLSPAWSLAALRNLLPPAIKPNKDSCLFLFESHNTFDKSWVYRYYNENDTSYLYYKNTNEVDACVEMIEKLNELNLL